MVRLRSGADCRQAAEAMPPPLTFRPRGVIPSVMELPLVSVVIPTHNRPSVIGRAISSALAQTCREIEVVAVIDGPDDATVTAIAAIADPRVRICVLPCSRGVASALNAGIQAARGRWIAILADDDEWMPAKLSLQLETATASRFKFPLVSCRMIARHDMGDLIWPRRAPDGSEPLSEYLFCQDGLRAGEKLLGPSTFLAPRGLFELVPFTDGLRRNEDADWLLRVSQTEGFGIEFVISAQPLVVYHFERDPGRSSHSGDWQSLFEWGKARRDLLTAHAYAAFVLRVVSDAASRRKDWRVFFKLTAEARRGGKPDRFDWLAHLAIWLVPFGLRRRLDRAADRVIGSTHPAE